MNDPGKDRLIELLMQKGFGVEGATIAADHLLANGVIVLPCKIGDTVYILAGRHGTLFEEDICDGFYIGCDGILQIKVQCHKGNHGTYGMFGKTVFLTREEAEQASKEATCSKMEQVEALKERSDPDA